MLKKRFGSPVMTVVLAALLVFTLFTMAGTVSRIRLPGDHRGYEPAQPIAYSHRLHAGEMKIDCRYCHAGAADSRHAGIPSAQVCMNCHTVVTNSFNKIKAEEKAALKEGRDPAPPVSPELQKLYDYLGLDAERKPDPKKEPRPIEWVRIHTLPDYVTFDHRAHVAANVACQECHGAVENMERVRQVSSLSMGWCVECHRKADQYAVAGVPARARMDCVSCHN